MEKAVHQRVLRLYQNKNQNSALQVTVHKIKLIPKTIENRKRDCAWGLCSEDKHHLRKLKLQIEKHKSGRRSFRSLDWFALFDLQIFSEVVFILRAQPHAQSLFLFSIVVGINLIHFDEKKVGAAGKSIVCFGASIPCQAIWQKQNGERKLFRKAQRFWHRIVSLASIRIVRSIDSVHYQNIELSNCVDKKKNNK